jgi:hypothetical protein
MSGANVVIKMISGERYGVPKFRVDPVLKGESIKVDRARADILLDDFWVDAANNEQPYFKEVIEGEAEPEVRTSAKVSRTRAKSAK